MTTILALHHKHMKLVKPFTLESCTGRNFLSAPAPHPQNLNSPRTRRNLRNLARSRPAPAHFQHAPAPHTIPTHTRPALHFFGLKPAAVRKLLKTPN